MKRKIPRILAALLAALVSFVALALPVSAAYAKKKVLSWDDFCANQSYYPNPVFDLNQYKKYFSSSDPFTFHKQFYGVEATKVVGSASAHCEFCSGWTYSPDIYITASTYQYSFIVLQTTGRVMFYHMFSSTPIYTDNDYLKNPNAVYFYEYWDPDKNGVYKLVSRLWETSFSSRIEDSKSFIFLPGSSSVYSNKEKTKIYDIHNNSRYTGGGGSTHGGGAGRIDAWNRQDQKKVPPAAETALNQKLQQDGKRASDFPYQAYSIDYNGDTPYDYVFYMQNEPKYIYDPVTTYYTPYFDNRTEAYIYNDYTKEVTYNTYEGDTYAYDLSIQENETITYNYTPTTINNTTINNIYVTIIQGPEPPPTSSETSSETSSTTSSDTSSTTSSDTSSGTSSDTSSGTSSDTSSGTSSEEEPGGGVSIFPKGLLDLILNFLNPVKGLFEGIKGFIDFLSSAFSFIPDEIWILIGAGVAVSVVLRILGR